MTAKIKLNAASGGGSFSLQAPSSSSNARVMTLPDTADGTILTTTNPKAGNILQVVSTTKTDTFSTNSYTLVDITGLSLSITPSSSSSKILVHLELEYGGDDMYFWGRVIRDSTAIGLGDANSNHTRASFDLGTQDTNAQEYRVFHSSYQILDSPNTTSATTYKIQVQSYGTDSRYLYINRSKQDGDSSGNSVAWQGRTSSTLTAMEVAA